MTKKGALDFIADQLAEFFSEDPDKIVHWLFTPNPFLGYTTPADLMVRHPNGRKKVASLIKHLRSGDI